MKVTWRLLSILFSVVVLCSLASWSAAEVHSWEDDQGVLHFSQERRKEGRGASSDAGKHKPQQKTSRPAKLPSGKGPVFMWKASSDSNFAWLLGSLHYAQEDLYPLDTRIEAAFDQCRALAVESDVQGKQAEVQALTMKMGLYPEGDSLDKHVSERTKGKLKELGAWNPMFMRLRPWLLAMQLQSQKFLEQGFNPEKGIDAHFMRQARQEGKQVVELEDAADTLRIFADFSEDQGDKFLYYTLLELDRFDEVVPSIAKHWRAGNAEGMRQLIFRELNRRPEFKELGRKLFDERNVKMARKIEGYLESGTPYFVVVGAGHLVGDMGVPKLLEKKGYDVRQVGAE